MLSFRIEILNTVAVLSSVTVIVPVELLVTVGTVKSGLEFIDRNNPVKRTGPVDFSLDQIFNTAGARNRFEGPERP